MEGKTELPLTREGEGGALGERRPPPVSDDARRGVSEAQIIAMLLAGGFAHTLAAGGRDEAGALAQEALNGWVGAGLPHRSDSRAGRRFDPAEVVNHFKWAGLTGRDAFWRSRWIATGRRLTRELAADDPAGPIHASLLRTFELGGIDDGREIRLRAPAPLDGPDHAVCELEAWFAGGEAARPRVEDVRITTRVRREAGASAALGWRAVLAPPAPPDDQPALSAEERELYLRPSEGFVRTGPRVRDLAAVWAQGLAGWDAAVAFRRAMGARFCLGVVGHECFQPHDALDWVLDHGWFDCVVGSALLVSLCRARGTPARLVTGRFLYPLNASDHTWTEVWSDDEGWRPIDLAGWDLAAGDRDAEWRDAFIGKLERRMVTERPPRRVMGPVGLRSPPAVRVLQAAADGGLRISRVDASSGRTLYVDQVGLARQQRRPSAP